MTLAVSVVVPTRDRPGPLARCLASLARQTLGRDRFEVIVVDDGGSPDLAPILAGVAGQIELVHLRQDHAGPAEARNRGTRHAGARHVAFTDDNCVPARDWLEQLLAEVETDGGAPVMVGGRIDNALTANVFSAATQLVLDLVYDHFNAGGRRPYFFASMNLAVPKRPLLEIGGFDASFLTAEDRELCDRWRASGHGLVYAPAARVHHAHDLDLGSFWQQHVGYGRGAAHYHRARAARASGTLLAESGFHAALPRLLRRHLRGVGWKRGVRLLSALLVWQIANTAGYFAGPVRTARG
ncbi:MAG: glycosyltransferase [Thermoanaerobaculia bacterium]|nr:glycosyltransferase [Thermoanaerobaculia bacterium]